MSIEDLKEQYAQNVEGENGVNEDIFIYTLSTCMWCKKCKRYLDENNIKYSYIDVDTIDPNDKARILEYLRTNYQERISYPFLTCSKGHVVGYDPNKYEDLLKEGGE
ncbi:MAG: glutaredoxin family protein [Candidatus Lokiarchaeota archaeon]|nr:glutaredoxin family protein [Candidatus Lokiarchaeota archaeon]